MLSWTRLRRLTCAPALLLGLALGGESAANPTPPNVLLILVDDLGWTDWERSADLNPTGSIVYETPNLDRLARSGVVFDNAYASSPVCSPSRSSIMTGKAPARSRITDFISGSGNQSVRLSEPPWTKDLPLTEITLPEALVSAGYETGFFGKWHLGQEIGPATDPLLHGFGLNIAGHYGGSPGPSGGYFAGQDGRWELMPGIDVEGTYSPITYLPEPLATHAEQFIEAQALAGTPFFAELALYLVHWPYEAPQPLIDYFLAKITTLQGQGADLGGHYYARYAAMVRKMDEAVGRLLDRLDDPNDDGNTLDSIRDNTIIVLVSDNGGDLHSSFPITSNEPLREGKGSLYEGGIRVPFMVSWTGNPALPDASGTQGRLTSARTSSYDIYTTLLDLTGVLAQPGIPVNTDIDGVSLRAALEDQPFDRGYQFWHYPHKSPQHLNNLAITGGSFVSAVRMGRWKLVLRWENYAFELYDVENDPGETLDLSGLQTGVLVQLLVALGDWLEQVDAQLPIETATGLEIPFPALPIPALGPLARGVLISSLLLTGLGWRRLLRSRRWPSRADSRGTR